MLLVINQLLPLITHICYEIHNVVWYLKFKMSFFSSTLKKMSENETLLTTLFEASKRGKPIKSGARKNVECLISILK